MFARTPTPPYWAVIFSSQRSAVEQGYADMGERMVELAAEQPGFLGVESVRCRRLRHHRVVLGQRGGHRGVEGQ